MKKSEIDAMNRSFAILYERRSHLLLDERTQDLKEKVKKIREYSISNLDDLLDKGIKTVTGISDRHIVNLIIYYDENKITK